MNRRAAQVVVIALALAVSAWVHHMAGYTLPPPWDDEAAFLWPANSFAHSNTLLAPQLNPDRHVYWMPPGYMLIIGVVFKVTGFSLDVARWFSWACVALSFAALALSFNRYPLPLFSTSLLTLFFLNGTFVTAGNIARMDALLLLSAVTTFCLLQADLRWPATAIAVASPLIHPNGLYFAFGAAAWLVYRHGVRWGKPSRLGWAALLAVALAWAAYAAYVLPHWELFRSDVARQFAQQFARSPVARVFSVQSAVPVAWFALLSAGAALRRRDLMLPLAFGGCSYLIMRIRPQMWYEVFHHFAFLVLGLASIWLVWILLERRKALAVAGVAVLALVLLHFYSRHGFIEGLRGYPGDMMWDGGMKMADGVAYLTRRDVDRVKAEVERHLSDSGTARVAFYPAGDSVFFADAWGAGALPFKRQFSDIKPDILVARTSRYLPVWYLEQVRVWAWSKTKERALAAIPDGTPPFHERDGTERWYLVDLRK